MVEEVICPCNMDCERFTSAPSVGATLTVVALRRDMERRVERDRLAGSDLHLVVTHVREACRSSRRRCKFQAAMLESVKTPSILDIRLSN